MTHLLTFVFVLSGFCLIIACCSKAFDLGGPETKFPALRGDKDYKSAHLIFGFIAVLQLVICVIIVCYWLFVIGEAVK